MSSSAGGATPAEPVVGAGLAEHVYQLLKAEVINDQFEAEQRIVIETVAIRLGVSPTPVREALARLAGEQLVAFRAYVGYSALPPLSLGELNDLFEAREAIECAGAVRACERASESDVERLRAIDAHIRAGHYGKERYSEFAAFVNDNQRFHETLLDAARNPELRRAFDALNYEARIARRTRGRGIPDLELICQEHTAIIAALAARDAPALVAAVAGHARESHQRLADDLARKLAAARV
ncbi:MAG TPA: GntR family transcriptional regulator [Gaiellales bacterium]